MLKNTYSSPEAELLEIRFEENYLASLDNFNKEENIELFVDDGEVDI